MNAIPSSESTIAARLQFAADTLIRCRQGQWLIHTTSSQLPAFHCDQPQLIGWLCRFARPLRLSEALQGLNAGDRQRVLPIIEYLQRSGALVAAESEACEEADPERSHQRSQQHLRLLADSVYQLAADLAALGPETERHLRQRGAGAERRLMALLSAVDQLRAELQPLRKGHIDRQLDALGLHRNSQALNLHLGCGDLCPQGWVNIDIHPAPLSLNLHWGLPFAEGSVHRVYLSHLLEHLFFPGEVMRFLAELRRVMRPGAKIRIVVPDIEQCLRAYVAADRDFFAHRREHWEGWPETFTPLADFLNYAGAGPEPGYLFASHKYGYDAETLGQVLGRAGFVDIRRCAHGQSEDPLLCLDALSATASAAHPGGHYSLFMEARAP